MTKDIARQKIVGHNSVPKVLAQMLRSVRMQRHQLKTTPIPHTVGDLHQSNGQIRRRQFGGAGLANRAAALARQTILVDRLGMTQLNGQVRQPHILRLLLLQPTAQPRIEPMMLVEKLVGVGALHTLEQGSGQDHMLFVRVDVEIPAHERDVPAQETGVHMAHQLSEGQSHGSPRRRPWGLQDQLGRLDMYEIRRQNRIELLQGPQSNVAPVRRGSLHGPVSIVILGAHFLVSKGLRGHRARLQDAMHEQHRIRRIQHCLGCESVAAYPSTSLHHGLQLLEGEPRLSRHRGAGWPCTVDDSQVRGRGGSGHLAGSVARQAQRGGIGTPARPSRTTVQPCAAVAAATRRSGWHVLGH